MTIPRRLGLFLHEQKTVPTFVSVIENTDDRAGISGRGYSLLFAIIDGDDVGHEIEAHLLTNDVSGFVRTSETISAAIELLASHASRIAGVTVVSVGGDSILLQVGENSITRLSDELEALQRPGHFTFSVGIGATLRESFIALRMAKSSGKCRITSYSEL
ncbi:mCpol domain-containing protein [Streptomyces sp. NPDC059743]|uniref:mCpol domain-containing protein n=1 Tax=Streptomyces sp. NPDC059743 TaxID=3346928 RepID=UPI003661FDE5